MKENPFEMLQKSEELDIRDKKLIESELELKGLIVEQNIRFENLRKGYKALGLLDESQDEIFVRITREEYYQKLQILGERYEMINNNPQTREELYEARNELEKYVVDSILLMGDRCNTICAYKNLWNHERAEKRKIELELITNDCVALEKSQMEQSKWIEFANQLFYKHNLLIKEQERLIFGEEELHNELKSIYQLKENIFILAQKLFLV